jgi:DNA-binding response OmpR family regulator
VTESSRKKRILVVDDHPQVLKFIGIDLKLRGFEVLSTGSGADCLKMINQSMPDIVLLDVLMPGMNGFDVLKELRKTSDLPVIAFSASPGNQGEALRLGASDFMHKPFDPDEMARKINKLLQ